MKRRIRWPVRLHGWIAARRAPGPDRAPGGPGRARLMAPRIVLRFRDGSSVILDPRCQASIEMHRVADQWLTGR